MLNLEPVAIAPRLSAIIPQPPLKLIPITQPKLACSETKRDRNCEPILPNLAPAKWLHPNVQIIWRHAEILSPAKRESNPDAFVDRTADITPQPQRPQNIKIKMLCNWNRELNIGPHLIVVRNSLR